MPGTIIGVTVKFKSLFYDTHELWGKQLLTNSSLQRFFLQVGLQFSSRTLGHLPCANAKQTPHRCAALFQDSGNSLQALPKAQGLLSPSRTSGSRWVRAPTLKW